jgi:hypothetical protein
MKEEKDQSVATPTLHAAQTEFYKISQKQLIVPKNWYMA